MRLTTNRGAERLRERFIPRSSIILVFILVQFSLALLSTDAEARRDIDLPKHYTLTGVIGLEYERRWGTISGSDAESISSFTQSYSLEVRGPVIDPRLVILDVRGDFVDRSGSDGYNTRGFSVELDLLNGVMGVKNPKYNFINYLPKPIILRYSLYSGDGYTNSSYGFSMFYYLPVYFHFFSDGKFVSVKGINEMPGRLKFNQGNANGGNGNGNGNGNDSDYENNNQNQNQSQSRDQNQTRNTGPAGFVVPFPFFSVDFDRNIYKSGDIETDTTQFDTRAHFSGRKYRYSIDYNSSTTESSDGKGNSHDRALTVDAWNLVHWFQLPFELQTIAEFRWLDDTSSVRVNPRATSRISRGTRTDFYINLGVDYQKTGDLKQYSATGSGTMQYRITPALMSLTSLGVRFEHTDDSRPPDPFAQIDPGRNPLLVEPKSTDYGLTVSETLQYSGIKNVVLNGGVSAGVASGGVPYGVFAGFTAVPVKWLSLNGNYSRSVTFINGEDTQSNDEMRLGAIAYLMNGLNVEVQGDRQTTNVHNTISYDVTYDRVDLRLNWFYRGHSLNANGYVARNESTNPVLGLGAGRSNLWGYGIQYGTSLMRNLSLFVTYNYDKDRDADMTRSQLNPRLIWYYGKLAVTAEYREEKNEELGASRTDRRIFVSLKRYFRKRL